MEKNLEKLITIMENIDHTLSKPFWADYGFWAGILNVFILFLTLYWVFRYAKAAQRLTIEAQKQSDFEMRPVLKMRWDREKPDHIFGIVNSGRGIAIDVEFERFELQDGDSKVSFLIKSRPLIPASGSSSVHADELCDSQKGGKKFDYLEIKDYINKKINTYSIKATYKDIENNLYAVEFKSDSDYSNGFKIVCQDRLNNKI